MPTEAPPAEDIPVVNPYAPPVIPPVPVTPDFIPEGPGPVVCAQPYRRVEVLGNCNIPPRRRHGGPAPSERNQPVVQPEQDVPAAYGAPPAPVPMPIPAREEPAPMPPAVPKKKHHEKPHKSTAEKPISSAGHHACSASRRACPLENRCQWPRPKRVCLMPSRTGCQCPRPTRCQGPKPKPMPKPPRPMPQPIPPAREEPAKPYGY
ncbi:hypothetical protein OSTOST_17882 [Ostertagia ostertagi]